MRRVARSLPGLLPLIAGLVAGCGPPRYEAPALDEPHAVVTVRVVHHEISGRDLAHQTLIDGHEVSLGRREVALRGTPLTRAVRVRPLPSLWRFESVFSHTEMRMETVYENERYACGTQTVGFGTSSRTETRYCDRQVPRQRWRPVRVTDGECRSALRLAARIDRRYLVQFDYHGNRSCRARCFEQTPLAGGRFQLSPCGYRPEPPPPPRVARPTPAPRAPSSPGSRLAPP